MGDVVLKLREDAFAAVMERDMSFYDENPSGKIVSRVTSDTQDFSTVVTLTLNLLSQVLLVVLIAIVLFVINRDAGAAGAGHRAGHHHRGAGLPAHRARHHHAVAARAWRGSTHTIQETISGIAVAKNFRQEQADLRRVPRRQRAGVPGQPAHRLRLQQHLPDPEHRWPGLGTASLVYFGGLQRAARQRLGRATGICSSRASPSSGSR